MSSLANSSNSFTSIKPQAKSLGTLAPSVAGKLFSGIKKDVIEIDDDSPMLRPHSTGTARPVASKSTAKQSKHRQSEVEISSDDSPNTGAVKIEPTSRLAYRLRTLQLSIDILSRNIRSSSQTPEKLRKATSVICNALAPSHHRAIQSKVACHHSSLFGLSDKGANRRWIRGAARCSRIQTRASSSRHADRKVAHQTVGSRLRSHSAASRMQSTQGVAE